MKFLSRQTAPNAPPAAPTPPTVEPNGFRTLPGTSASLLQIPLAELHVDTGYQRVINHSFVAYLVANWKPEAVGLLQVSRRRDGSYWVTDGQHRLAAMHEVDWTHALCWVTEATSRSDEATRFVHHNKHKTVDLADIFRGLLAAGDTEAIALNSLIHDSGWTILPHAYRLRHAGQTASIAVLDRLHRRNAAQLARALKLLLETWPDEPKIGRGPVIEAMFMLLNRGGERLNPKRVAQQLGSVNLSTLVNRGEANAREQRLSTATGIAREMAAVYNRALKAPSRILFGGE